MGKTEWKTKQRVWRTDLVPRIPQIQVDLQTAVWRPRSGPQIFNSSRLRENVGDLGHCRQCSDPSLLTDRGLDRDLDRDLAINFALVRDSGLKFWRLGRHI